MVRQKQEISSTNVELKYYGTAEQRPGDQHGFGFGNVQTGQVRHKNIHVVMENAAMTMAENRECLCGNATTVFAGMCWSCFYKFFS